MAAETENTLSKVDSLVEEAPVKKPGHRRGSSLAADVYNINDLEKENKPIKIAIETQKLGWKLNTSPSSIDDKDVLKKPLTEPKIKKIDLHFPLGLEVTARNLKGVTIKDALDAIHKQFKKKDDPADNVAPQADDELDAPYLAGFEWDPEECYTRFIVHQKKTGEQSSNTSGKKKKKGAHADE
ncbi:hypothetical protein BU24DRAFT_473324 [Aaosphaeria arxii CBS 175.79]|uniref:DUF6699 domain-containing protein n=1 Tax=Aaosphaeria arxii CBS 175.79 TaxID=1450172 RepID=A0A6A5XBC8_9PLEO|nr:uncharacterized protein BU24DRAFT_473324 [Aaosphaeria arxii CBS 175.79]KAF2010146.1 hypothetical protein BU24DRAFT_473324 [Aaosphaeria arxii CBS 175.79]